MTTRLPGWITIIGWIIVGLQVVNATILRFFTDTYTAGLELPPLVLQMLINPFSSRIYALYLMIGVTLWLGERRPLAFLLITAATIEIIDSLTIVINTLLGRSDPAMLVFAVPVILFILYFLAAARYLLRASSPTQ